MKTDVIVVSSRGSRMESALAEVDKVAAYKSLSPKQALHLRLLTEEMMGMVRSITGEMNGMFWIENKDKAFTLHLSTKTVMDAIKRYQFLSTSTTNRNEAAKGFIGFLRDKFEAAMLAEDNSVYYDSNGMILDEAPEENEWDRYERSILRKLADEIRIGVRGGNVEMEVVKKF